MIGKSGKHYNNPNVARSMNDAPDELGAEPGATEERDPVAVSVSKTPEGYRSLHDGKEQEHADFDALVEHLREALAAHGDGDGDDAAISKVIGKAPGSTAHAAPMKSSMGGGLSSLSSL